MRGLAKVLLVVGVAALVATPALAQQRGQGGRGRGGFGPGAMFQNPDVQKELKLTDEQKEKIQAASKKVNEKYAEDFQKLRDTPREEQPAKRQELNGKISADLDKELAGILQPDQLKRCKQIQIQQRGLQAFGSPDVQAALKLTDEQKDKIKTIGEDVRKEMGELRGGFQTDPDGTAKKIATLRKESMEKAVAVLTDDQKKSWKEMTGTPFEFRFQPRRPGGGGNRRQPPR